MDVGAVTILAVYISVHFQVMLQYIQYLGDSGTVDKFLGDLRVHFLAEVQVALQIPDPLLVCATRGQHLLDGVVEHFVLLLEIGALGLLLLLARKFKTTRSLGR